ncbi:MAG: AAA family ATPase, partial [candidate division NC10 bacterium]|nr:AAA family ATPase [candidate division NC10 bacterium]
IADRMGVDRSTVSKVLGGTYEAQDMTAMLERIRAFRLSVEGPTGISAVIGFRLTRTAQAIFDAYDLALARGEMVVLVGEGGEGKTQAFREIVRRAPKKKEPPPVYIACNVFTSAYALALRIAKELCVRRAETAEGTMVHVADHLRYAPRPLIIDEVNYLQRKAVDALRWIRDETGIGILMAGNTSLNGVAAGSARAGLLFDILTHQPGLEPFVSRARILEMPGILRDEVEAIATDVLGPFADQGMERLAERVGRSMRILARLIEDIRELHTGQRGPIGAAMVDQAWQNLYGRRGVRRGA